MDESFETYPANTQAELADVVKAMSKPGVIFSEPLREKNLTLITSYRVKASKGQFVARPFAVIVVSDHGVKVKPLRSPAQTLMFILFLTWFFSGGIAILLFPPWKPGITLFSEVRHLILTIRGIYEAR